MRAEVSDAGEAAWKLEIPPSWVHGEVPIYRSIIESKTENFADIIITRMWANAQRDGRPAECRWRLLFNSAKLG